MALALLWQPMAAAAVPPAQLLALAQKSTFEVVLPKIEPDYVHYEKPLPLELLSYRERTDKYWSIGTAFAIAPDVYVSAAHVLLSAMGSPMGQPRLRDADGRTYPVDEVLKFSMHEDYIVFRAKGATAAEVLSPNREPATGGTVYAVGNALGDGVVLRDGLLTSLTPEDQDGRWKWLRFSAAASPGNSGGPLLDSDGHVLGVVTAKSPSENLNYALPIARVLDGATAGVADVRSSFGIPILRQQMVSTFKYTFALPKKWDEFAQAVIEHGNSQYLINQHRLLKEHAGELPPGGDAAKLLATLDRSIDLGVIHQQSDDTWDISEPEDTEETRLPGGGSLSTGSITGATSFTLERSADQSSGALYHDDVTFMDTLLKGIKLPRVIGPQAIRITSLGAPQQRELHTDRFGRIWQMRIWAVGYTDMLLVTVTLPTPAGYAGLLEVTQAASLQNTLANLYLLADYTHVSYQGSPAQWQALLDDTALCPPFLRRIRIGKGVATFVPLDGLDVTVPAEVLAVSDDSRLTVQMRYVADGAMLHSEPGGITLSAKPGDDASWVGVWSQPRPAESAGKDLADRWRHMSSGEAPFTGEPQHTADFAQFWTDSVLGNAGGDLLYEATLVLHEKALLPRQVSERRDQLLSGLKLQGREH